VRPADRKRFNQSVRTLFGEFTRRRFIASFSSNRYEHFGQVIAGFIELLAGAPVRHQFALSCGFRAGAGKACGLSELDESLDYRFTLSDPVTCQPATDHRPSPPPTAQAMDENFGGWTEAGIYPTEDHLHGGLVGRVSVGESEPAPDQESIMDLDDDRVGFILVTEKLVDADKTHYVRDPCGLERIHVV
jgi:hypothetical protein